MYVITSQWLPLSQVQALAYVNVVEICMQTKHTTGSGWLGLVTYGVGAAVMQSMGSPAQTFVPEYSSC